MALTNIGKSIRQYNTIFHAGGDDDVIDQVFQRL
jgi:hypothetical protein